MNKVVSLLIILQDIEAIRKPRATLIQQYSRQAAQPGTGQSTMQVKL